MKMNFRKLANNHNKELMQDMINKQAIEFSNLLDHVAGEANKGFYDLLISQDYETKVVERELSNLLACGVVAEKRMNNTYLLHW